MPLRDQIGLILHNVQANRGGALALETPTPIDPRIEGVRDLSTSSRASSIPPKIPKTPYNKSRKRGITEVTEETNDAGPSTNKKLDLGIALAGLTKEIERTRKQESGQQQALKLLQKSYAKRLQAPDFMKAIALFKEEANAVTFLTLEEGELRDIWLEQEIGSSVVGYALRT
jgi:hypothetical protein